VGKGEKVAYSDAERFDAEFKKRQSEINTEISIWSQSQLFHSKIQEQIRSFLSNHDLLTNLSKRLFENGIFISNFKDLMKKEIESNSNSRWMQRLKYLIVVLLGGIITFLVELFIRKCF
jgi:hypothetical protein